MAHKNIESEMCPRTDYATNSLENYATLTNKTNLIIIKKCEYKHHKMQTNQKNKKMDKTQKPNWTSQKYEIKKKKK